METLESGLHYFVDTIDPYFTPIENIIASWVQWSLTHANIYVVVGLVSLLVFPFYMAATAMYSAITIRAQQKVIKGKNILYVIA